MSQSTNYHYTTNYNRYLPWLNSFSDVIYASKFLWLTTVWFVFQIKFTFLDLCKPSMTVKAGMKCSLSIVIILGNGHNVLSSKSLKRLFGLHIVLIPFRKVCIQLLSLQRNSRVDWVL